MENRFTQEDIDKLIQLLNTVAEKAVFKDMAVADIIKVFSLLTWSQKSLLEKIKANLLEVVKVEEIKPEPKPKKGK